MPFSIRMWLSITVSITFTVKLNFFFFKVRRILTVKARPGGSKECCPSTFHRRSDGIMTGLPHPACKKEIGGWKIMLLPQGLGDAFELNQDWKVMAGQFPPKYDHSTSSGIRKNIYIWKKYFTRLVCYPSTNNYYYLLSWTYSVHKMSCFQWRSNSFVMIC